jgi:hypothetical protein
VLGEKVQRLDGTTATVVGIRLVPGEADMYDLTVSEIHSFAVGKSEVVVHNTCPTPKSQADFLVDPEGNVYKQHTPDFIGAPDGTIYPVPKNAHGPVPVINKNKNTVGHAFTDGDGSPDTIRLMGPNKQYSKGYIKYTKKGPPGTKPQQVDYETGRPISDNHEHAHFAL